MHVYNIPHPAYETGKLLLQYPYTPPHHIIKICITTHKIFELCNHTHL